MMSNARLCPACGRNILAKSPVELCPQCLLNAGFESRSAKSHQGMDDVDELVDPHRETVRTSPVVASRFVAPEPAMLAGLFPQLTILELIGKGGMGAVYKARQPGLDRLVAVKILPSEIGSDPAFAERFQREARALARLDHPHIVRIHDFGHVSELYYLVMEYVDGVNLRQAIQARSVSPREALLIVPQICEALQFAHDEGIVHRDIKPENILLDRKGRVKIADFGLAKLLKPDSSDPALTGTHQVMGTLRYMAPEQLEQTRDIDHRADIYSLGVVFYELLTHELPLGRFALPSEKAAVDTRLDGVVLRALEKEPDLRYQQASELRSSLESMSSCEASASSSPGTETRRNSSVPAQPWTVAGELWNRTRLSPACVGVIAASAGMYVFSLFLPAGYLHIDQPGTYLEGRSMSGFEAFQGSLQQGYGAWFANPALWCAWLVLAFGPRWLSLVVGMAAVVMALGVVLQRDSAFVHQSGYSCWVASMLLQVIGTIAVISRESVIRRNSTLTAA